MVREVWKIPFEVVLQRWDQAIYRRLITDVLDCQFSYRKHLREHVPSDCLEYHAPTRRERDKGREVFLAVSDVAKEFSASQN